MIRALINYAQIVLATVPALFRTRREQAIVELALRQQLATYAHQQTKPQLTPLDRTFWVALSRIWPRWREVLCIVQAETVVRWHREGFRLYWRSISRRGPGRPRISPEVPRRKVLDVLLKVTLVGWLGSVLYPIISYLRPLPQEPAPRRCGERHAFRWWPAGLLRTDL